MTAYRDVGRPDQFTSKRHLAEWIAEQSGADVNDVIKAKRSASKAAGQEWRGDDKVGAVRQRALHRLRTTAIRNVARDDAVAVEPAPEARLTAPDPAVAARARRMLGGLK